MKKIFLFFSACLITISVYANTCIYSGKHVSLLTETTRKINGQCFIQVSTNDKNVSRVRCQVEVEGQRKWIDISMLDGNGAYDLAQDFILPDNKPITVKLVEREGECY